MPDVRKTATEIVDITFNWAPTLNVGDSIVTSAWSVPSGITGGNQSSTSTTTSIRLSSGSTALFYPIINTVSLASGQKYQAPLNVSIGG